MKQTDGILLSNWPIPRTDPAIVDFAPTALAFFGKTASAQYSGKPLLSEAPS